MFWGDLNPVQKYLRGEIAVHGLAGGHDAPRRDQLRDLARRSMGEEPTTGAARLRRSIGTATATATSAGLAFAAFDYLGVVSVLAYAAGASAALAILVGGVLVLLVAGDLLRAERALPDCRGDPAVPRARDRARARRCALTFTYMTTVVLVIAADAFLIGAAVRHVLGEPPRARVPVDRGAARDRARLEPARRAPRRLGADGRHLHRPCGHRGAVGDRTRCTAGAASTARSTCSAKAAPRASRRSRSRCSCTPPSSG